MKAYGMKRKHTCPDCKDLGCIDRKYNHMRGHSKAQRKNMEKQRKSSARLGARLEIARGE